MPKVKLPLSRATLKAPFSKATTPTCRGGLYSITWSDSLTLDPCLIMLSIKQGGRKYLFF